MALVKQCDVCEATMEPTEADAWWFKIDGKDACSPDCARDLLDDATQLLRENQHRFDPGSSEDLDCMECGDGPTAPQHWEHGRPAEIAEPV